MPSDALGSGGGGGGGRAALGSGRHGDAEPPLLCDQALLPRCLCHQLPRKTQVLLGVVTFSFNPNTWEASLQVQGQPGVCSGFQASQACVVRPCVRIQNQSKQKNVRNVSASET